MFEKIIFFFLRVSGMLEKKCLRVSGMLEQKGFFCVCQVSLKRNGFFLRVSGILEKKCFFFSCVKYA